MLLLPVLEAYPAGPHQWRNAKNQELPSVHLDQACCVFVGFVTLDVRRSRADQVPGFVLLQEPFGPALMVIHYESCPFSRWQDIYVGC